MRWCTSCIDATMGACRRGCGNARSSARASRSSTRRCGSSRSAATTRRRSPTSPRPRTSRRAPSSRTSPRRRRWSSTPSTDDLDGLAGTLRERLPGETAFDALRRWIDLKFDDWLAEKDEALLRKRLCREDEGLANFEGGMMARIQELMLDAIAAGPRRAADGAPPAPRRRRRGGGAELAQRRLRSGRPGRQGRRARRPRRRDPLPAQRHGRPPGELSAARRAGRAASGRRSPRPARRAGSPTRPSRRA